MTDVVVPDRRSMVPAGTIRRTPEGHGTKLHTSCFRDLTNMDGDQRRGRRARAEEIWGLIAYTATTRRALDIGEALNRDR